MPLLLSLKKFFIREHKDKVNHHFILIEASEKIVGPEIICWGESEWWPKECRMRFRNITLGSVRIGTEYEMMIRAPFASRFYSRVTKLTPDREIERTFLNGMFKGREAVDIEGRYNGTKVNYTMHYQIRGIFNKILWLIIFKKLHDKNIKLILSALKTYAEKKTAPLED